MVVVWDKESKDKGSGWVILEKILTLEKIYVLEK